MKNLIGYWLSDEEIHLISWNNGNHWKINLDDILESMLK